MENTYEAIMMMGDVLHSDFRQDLCQGAVPRED